MPVQLCSFRADATWVGLPAEPAARDWAGGGHLAGRGAFSSDLLLCPTTNLFPVSVLRILSGSPTRSMHSQHFPIQFLLSKLTEYLLCTGN